MGSPPETPRAEIAPGVFITVEELNVPMEATGRMISVEIHLDTPGTELVFRPFDESALERGRHFRLAFADWIIRNNDYLALINGTRYYPGYRWRSYPGANVLAVESIVIDGRWSHQHKHSVMIWWDDQWRGQVELSKPPRGAVLERAVHGIGVQTVQVRDAAVGGIASSGEGELISRSFIGIDPDQNIVWLIAFENVTERSMAWHAVQQGVVHGGQVDSGSATNLLLGRKSPGWRPFPGIRNLRPVANYLAVRHRAPEET